MLSRRRFLTGLTTTAIVGTYGTAAYKGLEWWHGGNLLAAAPQPKHTCRLHTRNPALEHRLVNATVAPWAEYSADITHAVYRGSAITVNADGHLFLICSSHQLTNTEGFSTMPNHALGSKIWFTPANTPEDFNVAFLLAQKHTSCGLAENGTPIHNQHNPRAQDWAIFYVPEASQEVLDKALPAAPFLRPPPAQPYRGVAVMAGFPLGNTTEAVVYVGVEDGDDPLYTHEVRTLQAVGNAKHDVSAIRSGISGSMAVSPAGEPVGILVASRPSDNLNCSQDNGHGILLAWRQAQPTFAQLVKHAKSGALKALQLPRRQSLCGADYHLQPRWQGPAGEVTVTTAPER